MRVENTNINSTQKSNNIANTSSQSQNIEIGKLLASNSVKTQSSNKTINGSNASITIERQENSSIPGFNTQKLTIKPSDGLSFTIDLHIDNSCNAENQNLTEKISKIISNLPSNVLEDLKEECKHIAIPKNIVYNKEAKGLAIGPLNQIFLSADRMKDMTNAEVSDTLIHELGHLIDYHKSSFGIGEATNSYKREFNKLKTNITKDLGFDTEAHTFKGVNELFADYYLYQSSKVSDNHRSKAIFDLLNSYKNDVETLSSEELQSKYGEKTSSIIELTNNWKTMERQFKYYLGNVNDPEIVDRMDETKTPMNLEQLNQQIEKQNKKF